MATTIYQNIADNNPQELQSLLLSCGVPKKYISNKEGLKKAFEKVALKKDGDIEFMERVVNIHPDKQLFEIVYNKEIKNEKQKPQNPASTQDKYVYADGSDAISKQNKDIKITNTAIGVLIGFGVMLGVLYTIKTVTK